MAEEDSLAHQRRIDFGNQLREARTSRGWSQEALAEHAGVERKVVYRTELGTHSPRLDTAWKLADALDVRLGSLLDYE